MILFFAEPMEKIVFSMSLSDANSESVDYMDTADFRVVFSKQYCGEHPPLKMSYRY
jgi:hypothetical protein